MGHFVSLREGYKALFRSSCPKAAMPGDPMGFFSLLMKVCIRDDPESRSQSSLLTVTAVSFVLGIAASGFTAYLMTILNL
jgi:hypothetical protein